MLGAIIGDIAGSSHEFRPVKGNKNSFSLFDRYSRFTDDTVLTCAVAEALMAGWKDDNKFRENVVKMMRKYGQTYNKAGYGGKFCMWLVVDNPAPYNSYGNGSAMRVSPIGWAFDTLEDVEKYAKISAEVTHNHPEGIKGACATAGSIFLARQDASKEEIKDYVVSRYGYDLSRSLTQIKPTYRFEVSCQKSVPEAIIAFLESNSFEEALRNAIWLGGDSDTQADIAGGIAQAFYKQIPADIVAAARQRLDVTLNGIVDRWQRWISAKK